VNQGSSDGLPGCICQATCHRHCTSILTSHRIVKGPPKKSSHNSLMQTNGSGRLEYLDAIHGTGSGAPPTLLMAGLDRNDHPSYVPSYLKELYSLKSKKSRHPLLSAWGWLHLPKGTTTMRTSEDILSRQSRRKAPGRKIPRRCHGNSIMEGQGANAREDSLQGKAYFRKPRFLS